jgi:hypothetical protein
LAYKPYGLENQEIGEKNYSFVFMNASQQRMLEKEETSTTTLHHAKEKHVH